MVVVLFCTASQASLSTNLIGHWKLDEASGSVATDSSGSGINGTYTNGATPGSVGIVGRAADFDGTDDHVVINGGSTYNTRDNFTIACWAKSDTATFNGHGCLVSKRHAWVLHPSNGGTDLYFHVANSAGNQYSGTFNMSELGGIQQWHHYVGVYDGTSGEIKLYVDGVLRESSTFTAGSQVNSNTSQMTIGKDSSYSSADRHFDGNIDEVRLYSRALSDDQIAALYSGLVAHYKFDETSGTTAIDSSEYGSDGTHAGGVTLGATGLRGYAADFDGTDDHIAVPATSDLNIRGSITLACWAKSDTENWTGYDTLIFKNGQFSLGTNNWEKTVYLLVKNESNSSLFLVNPIAIDSIQEWHHYVGVYDMDAGEIRLYIDGKLNGTKSVTAGQALQDRPSQTIYIGSKNASAYSDQLDGQIDDARIYDRALTEAEIVALYGDKAHYKFDETSGTVAADSSGSGHDGAYAGSPTLGGDALRGYSVALNGSDTDDRIDLPNTLVDGETTLTLSWWLRTTNTLHQTILSGATSSNSNSVLVEFQNSTSFRTLDPGGGDYYAVDSIADGRWRHFVYQRDLVTGVERLYINGKAVIDAVRATTATEFSVDTGGLLMGQEQDSLGGGFDPNQVIVGDLDDVRLYTRLISEQEIAELYGLVGHWKLDETSGSIAYDSSGMHNDGTVDGSGHTWVAGLRQNGLRTPSTSQVTVANNDSVNFGEDDFSVGFWFKLDPSLTGSYPALIYKKVSGTNPGWDVYYEKSSGEVELKYYNGTTNAFVSTPVTDNRWNHIVAIKKATSLEVYLNGVLAATTPHALTGSVDNSVDLTFGGITNNANLQLDGSMDDVVLYNRAMTAEEIAEHYGLVGHWKLDETSGTAAADSSPIGADGTYENGAMLGGDGIRNYATDFDAVDDYVRIPSNTAHDCREAFSIAAWVKLDTVSAFSGVFVRGDDAHQVFNIEILADGKFRARIGRAANDKTVSTTECPSVNALTAGRWHQVAAVWDGITVSIYLDGELEATYPLSGDLGYTTEDSTIGAELFGGDEFFDGQIDDVVLYNRAMTAEEIAEHYGLLLHLKMDESSGSVATDSSPFGHDGAITGAPTQNAEGVRGTGYDIAAGDLITVAETDQLARAYAEGHESFAIAFWVKPTKYPGTWRSIFQKGSSNIPRGPGVFFSVNNSGLHFAAKTASSTNLTFDSVSELDEEVWSHVVVQGRDRTVEFYINGQLDRTATLNNTPSAVAGPILIGNPYPSTYPPPGSLDDVRYYNRALGVQEIAELYGLVGHWKLDESSGSIAADSSGVANDGNFWNGAAPGSAGPYPGTGDTAAEFDGSSAHVGAYPVQAYDNITETMTAAAWVNFDRALADQTTQQKIMYREHYSANLGFALLADQPYGDRVIFRVHDGTAHGSATWTNPGIGGNEWHHFVGTYDGTTVRLYMDGELQASVAFASSIAQHTINNLAIGTDLDGRIHDARLYNRALNHWEVAQLYGLVGHWKLDETSGTTAFDSSGMQHDGTFTGTATWTTDAKQGSGSLNLDGTDYVEVPSLVVSDVSQGLAISGWTKVTGVGSLGGQLLTIGDAFALTLDDSGGSSASAFNGSTYDVASLGRYFENTGWHHFVASYNPVDLTVDIYLDGVKYQTENLSGPIDITGVETLTRIGAHTNNSSQNLTGKVDDLRVYNRAVSREEARALYYGKYVKGVRIIRWEETR